MQILEHKAITHITEWRRTIIGVPIGRTMHVIVDRKGMTITLEVSSITTSFGITDHSLAFFKINIRRHHST